jgi:RNA polymerase sigma-70 factor, ECF subfamily
MNPAPHAPCPRWPWCARLCTDEGLRAVEAAYRPRLLAVARRTLGDHQLAEEAVQEALVRAWRSCASLDPDRGSLLPWLNVVTRNVARDIARARRRRPGLVADPDADHADLEPSVGSAEEEVLLRSELARALAGVGSSHRAVVVEVLLHDRPHADVADDLGIPVGTVRSRLHYALRRLRAVLEDAGFEGDVAPA